jgi:hypothetical protein
MWSVGAAVLIWVAVCAGAVILAARRLRRQLEPTRRSFELLHREVVLAGTLVSRDTGRATASRRFLLRHGNAPASQ